MTVIPQFYRRIFGLINYGRPAGAGAAEPRSPPRFVTALGMAVVVARYVGSLRLSRMCN